jgi:hypothetical protein
MSLAVTVPPGLLMRSSTARTLESLRARSSCSRTRATMLSSNGSKMPRSSRLSLITPSMSSSRIFGPDSP